MSEHAVTTGKGLCYNSLNIDTASQYFILFTPLTIDFFSIRFFFLWLFTHDHCIVLFFLKKEHENENFISSNRKWVNIVTSDQMDIIGVCNTSNCHDEDENVMCRAVLFELNEI